MERSGVRATPLAPSGCSSGLASMRASKKTKERLSRRRSSPGLAAFDAVLPDPVREAAHGHFRGRRDSALNQHLRQGRIGLAVAAGEAETKHAPVGEANARRTLYLREEKIDIVPEVDQPFDARQLFQRPVLDGSPIRIRRQERRPGLCARRSDRRERRRVASPRA